MSQLEPTTCGEPPHGYPKPNVKLLKSNLSFPQADMPFDEIKAVPLSPWPNTCTEPSPSMLNAFGPA